MSEQHNIQISNTAAIRLVAGREISTRTTSKAFRITTLVLVVIIVALCVVMKLVSGSSSADHVGYLPQSAALAAPLRSVARSVDLAVDTQAVADRQAGEAKLRDGSLDALLIGSGGTVDVVVNKSLDPGLQSVMNVLAGQVALSRQILDLHGDPAKVVQAQAAARATVEPPLQASFDYQTQDLVLGIVAGVLIYMSLMLNGQTVAQGVVEEKSSRVVELLLSAIRPWQLMAGKVLGIGLVGLVQMLVIGVAGLIAGLATGVLALSVSAAVSTLIWLVVWYLLGFFMYAIVFAGLGALVSRQEDVSTVVTPALLFVIAGYVIGVSILPSDPGNPLVEVLSVIPMFAPTLMPMRLAMGGVPPWEAALAVVLVLAFIPALIWVAGRIYRNAVLQSGARVKFSHALRG